MTSITLRRHPIKFYFILVFTFLFVCALGTMILFVFIDLLQKGHREIMLFFLPLGSLGIFYLAFLMAFAYWKNVPIVIINNNTIHFGEQTFYLMDIKDVSLKKAISFSHGLSHGRNFHKIQ